MIDVKTKFSIIILTYNNELKKILITLKSVLLQSFDDFEIIFADDGSKKQWKKEIEDYLLSYNFSRYLFAPSDTNVGTVKNILRALKYTKGDYVKCIGAGDYLIDENVLSTVYEYMNQAHAKWGFSKLAGYNIEDNYIYNRKFNAPVEIWPYKKNDIKKIRERMIIYADNISGASIFFDRKHFIHNLRRMSECVVYAEDLVQILEILENEMATYIPKKLIGYEVGSGISTSQKADLRLQNDYKNFNMYLEKNYGNVEEVRKRIERPIILKQSNKIQKYIFLLFESPRRLVYEILNTRFHYTKKEPLGFLDREDYCLEFELKRF